MSYENFRTSITARLVDREIPPKLINDLLQELDAVASGYEIRKACTDLTVYEEVPSVLKMYCAALAVENKSIGTIDDYRRQLLKFFHTIRKPFNSITTNDIRVYLYNRQQSGELKKSTVEHMRVTINAFYQWLVDEEIMSRNPAKRIEPIRFQKKGRDPIPMVELETLRVSCKTLREKALIDFLYSTGCRVSECAALTLQDINWRERSVKIRHGKGDKERITYFNAESEVSLRKYLESKKHKTDALFSRIRAPYGHIGRAALEAEVRNIRARVGNLTAQVVPHALRTTFATNAAKNGMPVEHVQKLLGHSDINTTMRYVKTSTEEAKSNHRKYIA